MATWRGVAWQDQDCPLADAFSIFIHKVRMLMCNVSIKVIYNKHYKAVNRG